MKVLVFLVFNKMEFLCYDHEVSYLISDSSVRPPNQHIKFCYHVRSANGQQWVHTVVCYSEKKDDQYCYPVIQHVTNSCAFLFSPCLCHQIVCPPEKCEETNRVKYEGETLVIDEVDKKIYFFHFPLTYPNYVVREASIEVIGQKVQSPPSIRLFLGRLDLRTNERISLKRRGFVTDEQKDIIMWFLNPFDGSIFQILSYHVKSPPDKPLAYTSYHTVSWLKLDDSICIEAPSGMEYNGKVKVIAQCKFEFNKKNVCTDAMIFSKNGRKLLLRFRLPHPAAFRYSGIENTAEYRPSKDAKLTTMDPDSPYVSQMTKPPVYVLLGLDRQSHSIQVLTQFDPSSYKHHCDLLISSRLLSKFGDFVGLPNTAATSFVSQRTEMIGQFLKYTFFTAIHNQKLAILAVKSLAKTLLNGHMSLTPKKMWFPLEDEKFKEKVENYSESEVNPENYIAFVVPGHEFMFEVFNKVPNTMKDVATVAVKLGDEYKDYRKCANCAKVEQYKRRNINGKRISQFKVCGWCKDHNLHKMWWEQPCHYCCEKCADDHWPIHKFAHKQPIESKKGKSKGKKKKLKK